MSSSKSTNNEKSKKSKNFVGIEPFAYRQFDDPKYTGTKISDISKEEFVKKVNEVYGDGTKYGLKDGYAPFCKHIILPNFTEAKVSQLRITEENEKLLKTAYVARRPEELAVLSRWFPKGDIGELPKAKYLDVILYSKDQVIKENDDLPAEDKENALKEYDCDWYIVSIKAQDFDYELPMAPITMMRNVLGREFGGSGVPLDFEEYKKSVEYWKQYANIQ